MTIDNKLEFCIPFLPNKSFGQLKIVSPSSLLFLKDLKFINLEFSYIDVYFTDKNSKPSK